MSLIILWLSRIHVYVYSQLIKTSLPLSADIRHLFPLSQQMISKICPTHAVLLLLSLALCFSLFFFPYSFSHNLKSCFIWKLASFGKLAIRTILWEYVYVSLVFLPINRWSRRSRSTFPLDCCSSMEAWHFARSCHSC